MKTTDNDNAKTETETLTDAEEAAEQAWETEARAAADSRPPLAYLISLIAKAGPQEALPGLAWKLAGLASYYGGAAYDDSSPWKLLVAYVKDALAAYDSAEEEEDTHDYLRENHDWSAFSVAIHECFRVTTLAHLNAIEAVDSTDREEEAEHLALTSDILFGLKVLGHAVGIDLDVPAPLDLDAVVRRVHEAASGIGDPDVLTREAHGLLDASYTSQETEDAAHAVARLMLVLGERLTTRDPVKAAQ